MSSLYIFLKGCGRKCVEEFEYLQELTGWSQNTLMVVFFIGLFLLLLLIVFIMFKFRPKRYRKYNPYRHKQTSRYKKK